MIQYPSLREVELSDRNETYRWFLLLPCPRYVRDKKTKTYSVDPPGGIEIFEAIKRKWIEFGGRNRDIADKVMEEAKCTRLTKREKT